MNSKNKSNIELIVREGLEKDLSPIRRIETQSFHKPWRRETLRWTLLSDSIFVLVGEKQSVLGYAIFTPNRPRVNAFTMSEFPEESSSGHILNLAVSPDRRREGIATTLVDRVGRELESKGKDKIALEVRESNEAARNFYLQQGFEVTHTINGYYLNKDNAYVMEKQLG